MSKIDGKKSTQNNVQLNFTKMKTATSKTQKEKADYDSVIIPAEGLIHLEYLLYKALERIEQHKEELAKQNVPESDIELMYKAHEIFAHDTILKCFVCLLEQAVHMMNPLLSVIKNNK